MDRLPRNERRACGRVDPAPRIERRRACGPLPSAIWISEGLRPRPPAATLPTPTPPPAVRAVASVPMADDALPMHRLPTGWLALLGAAAVLIVAIVARSLAGHPPILVDSWRGLPPIGEAVAGSLRATLPGAPPFPELRAGMSLPGPVVPPDGRAADADVHRLGHASIRGGVLFVPDTFSSLDGAYDLLLHFHGNTAVVRESAEHAKVNAVVAVVNLGVGSAPYEEAYAATGSYEALLDEI